jgi:chaperone required for assembly of F1-ATPase
MKAAVKPVSVSVAAQPSGFALKHGNDDVRTPAGAALILPTQALAEAIAAEWNGQGSKINSALMPLMQLAMTAVDIAGKDRSKMVDAISAFAATELLCHRAENPFTLVERQTKFWQPHLDWSARRFNAPLVTAIGLMPIKQPPASLAALRHAVEAYDAFGLAGLRQAVETTGSLILGLALTEGRIDAAMVFEAAELDAGFQLEKWGEDPVQAARRNGIRDNLDLCVRWFGLLKQP